MLLQDFILILNFALWYNAIWVTEKFKGNIVLGFWHSSTSFFGIFILSWTSNWCRNCDHFFSILSFMWQLEEILSLETGHWWRFVYSSLLYIKVFLNHPLLHLLEWLWQLFFFLLLAPGAKACLSFRTSLERWLGLCGVLETVILISLLFINRFLLRTIRDLCHAW